MNFLAEATLLYKIFWYIAIASSLIFIIQTIMTFVGADTSDGVEADFDSNLSDGDHPFQLFSFRNLINFLLGFSWSGISFYESVANKNLLLVIATGIGILFVLLFFFIIKQLMKLAEDNSFQLKDAVGKTAEVYLTIPAHNQGKGKIQISIKGAYHELDAITDGEQIPSGKVIKVDSIIDKQLVKVSLISS